MDEKGRLLSILGRHEEAIACFDQLIEIDQHFEDVFIHKGEEMHHIERYAEAILCYDQATSRQPNSIYAVNKKAETLCALGKNSDAEELLDEIENRNSDIKDHMDVRRMLQED